MSSSGPARAVVFHAEDDISCSNHLDHLSPVSQLTSPTTIVDLRKTQRSIKRLASQFRQTEEKRSNLQLELEKMLNDRNVKLAAIQSMNIARAGQRFMKIQIRSLSIVINSWRNSAELRIYALRKICFVMQGMRVTKVANLKSTVLSSWKYTSSRLGRKRYSESVSRPWLLLPAWRRWMRSWRVARFEIHTRTLKLQRVVVLWRSLHEFRTRLDRLLTRARQSTHRRLANQVLSVWFQLARRARVLEIRVEWMTLKTLHNHSKFVWIVWCKGVQDGLRIQEKLELRFARTRQDEYKRKTLQSFLANARSHTRFNLITNRSVRIRRERFWKKHLYYWRGCARNQRINRFHERDLKLKISRGALKSSVAAWLTVATMARRQARIYRRINDSIVFSLVKNSFRGWSCLVSTLEPEKSISLS